MFRLERSSVRANDVRDFYACPLTHAGVSGHCLSLLRREQWQQVGCVGDESGGDATVPGSGVDAGMAEDRLNRPQLNARFQHMCCEAMPHGMWTNLLQFSAVAASRFPNR